MEIRESNKKISVEKSEKKISELLAKVGLKNKMWEDA